MEILLEAFVLGIIAGFVPGAVLTLLLVCTLQGGLSAGMRAFWWSMASEIVVAGGLLVVAAQLPLQQSFFTVVGVVGGIVLLYFSWNVFQLRSITVHEGSVLFTAPRIFILSATNAPLYIFWSTICFPLIWQLSAAWSLSIAALSFFVVFEIAWGISTFATVLLFVFARSVLGNERIMHKVFVVLALIFAGFGIKMLFTSLMLLF